MPPTTIPLLPCGPFEETVSFWQAMGFDLTYRQKTPNAYASLRHADGYEFHCFGMEDLQPKNNYGMCIVMVPEVETLHGVFSSRLKVYPGPKAEGGFPRISRMKPGQTRFTIRDVAGNSVIYIKSGPEDQAAAQAYLEPGLTPLQRALALAARLRDFLNDDAEAAKTLDRALRYYKPERENPGDYRRVLEARLELAEALGQAARLKEIRKLLKQA